MKTTLLVLAITLNICYAQTTLPPTTEIEYTWATKGYKDVIEKGNDMKIGYRVDDMAQTIKMDSYEFTFKAFVREKGEELAGVIVIVNSPTWGNKYYLCIPIQNVGLLPKYYQSMSTWDRGLSNAYAKVTSAMMAEFLGQAATK